MKPEAETVIKNALEKMGLKLSDEKLAKLLAYCTLLIEGLRYQRLTGESNIIELINRQITDCLFPLIRIVFKSNSRIVDLGSGGGLPGVPLAICVPEVSFYLLEANQRKAAFLEKTIKQLDLNNVFILIGRAELFGHDNLHREKYDYVVSKAVASTAALAELALPLLKIGGEALFYKGPLGRGELFRAARAIELCGGRYDDSWEYILPAGEKRFIYQLKKIKETPREYPRSPGKPARKPLY